MALDMLRLLQEVVSRVGSRKVQLVSKRTVYFFYCPTIALVHLTTAHWRITFSEIHVDHSVVVIDDGDILSLSLGSYWRCYRLWLLLVGDTRYLLLTVIILLFLWFIGVVTSLVLIETERRLWNFLLIVLNLIRLLLIVAFKLSSRSCW